MVETLVSVADPKYKNLTDQHDFKYFSRNDT